VIGMMDKHTIRSLKDQVKSIREIARTTGFARKTVNRHWERYQEQLGPRLARPPARLAGGQAACQEGLGDLDLLVFRVHVADSFLNQIWSNFSSAPPIVNL